MAVVGTDDATPSAGHRAARKIMHSFVVVDARSGHGAREAVDVDAGLFGGGGIGKSRKTTVDGCERWRQLRMGADHHRVRPRWVNMGVWPVVVLSRGEVGLEQW